MAVIKYLNEMEENADWQFNELIKKSMSDKNTLPKDGNLKKNQIDLLVIKNSIKEIKNKL